MPTLKEAHDERDEADEGSGRCQVGENGGKTKRRGSLSELWEKADVERPTEVDGRNEAQGSEGRRVASALDGVKIVQLRRCRHWGDRKRSRKNRAPLGYDRAARRYAIYHEIC